MSLYGWDLLRFYSLKLRRAWGDEEARREIEEEVAVSFGTAQVRSSSYPPTHPPTQAFHLSISTTHPNLFNHLSIHPPTHPPTDRRKASSWRRSGSNETTCGAGSSRRLRSSVCWNRWVGGWVAGWLG